MRDLARYLEALGGALPLPRWLSTWGGGALLGLWWAALLLLAWAFAGSSTKFIYIDF